MIAYLQGRVLEQNNMTGILILDVNGVGYELFCSQNALSFSKKSQPLSLWVYTHVREDQLQLFGFYEEKEKKLFLSLLKVNGIGAKMALNILSASSVDSFIDIVEQEDVKALLKLPKVGKKTAEQIVLSLRGKLVLSKDGAGVKGFRSRSEIISALVNLGFKLPDVEFVVDQMNKEIEIEQGIREGLAALTKS